MVAIPVLITVGDTPEARTGALTITKTSPKAPPTSINLSASVRSQTALRSLRIEPDYPPTPLTAGAAKAVVSLATAAPGPAHGTLGGAEFLMRGTIDDSEIDASKSVTDDQGSPRIFVDPPIGMFPLTCGSDPAVGDTLDVRKHLGIGRLRSLQMDGSGTAIAIMDNGINLSALRAKGLNPKLDSAASWSPRVSILPGTAPVDHGTMCAFDALIAAPNATLLDYSLLLSTRTGGSIMQGFLSDAVLGFAKLLTLLTSSPQERSFHSLIVSNSWGMFSWSWDFPPSHPGRYGDNPNHPFNRQVSAVAGLGADVLFAAGNCGPTCPDGRCDVPPPVAPVINGANSHPEVITVAGVDTNRQLVGYSSQGPGALFQEKPDIASFTHFLGSEAFGRGVPDTGTSAACPVMAGVVAALRSLYPFDPGKPNRTPQNIKQFLLNSALQPSGALGWRNDLGHGIVDTTAFGSATAIS